MGGPLGQHQKWSHGYFSYPKLEGEIGPHMQFNGKEHLVWSLNNYLGLANHPEVREADARAAADFGMAYPMGARMMSGNSIHHEQLEHDLGEFVGKEDAYLLNYGYQGMVSIIDTLVDRNDVIVYDAESHACIQSMVCACTWVNALYTSTTIWRAAKSNWSVQPAGPNKPVAAYY